MTDIIKLKGVADVLNKLSVVSAASLKAIDQEIETGGLMIKTDAQKLAPVDTGNLRRSIIEAHKPFVSIVKSLANYSTHVNYGTRKQKAQPYFTNAVNLNKHKILRNVNKAVAQALK